MASIQKNQCPLSSDNREAALFISISATEERARSLGPAPTMKSLDNESEYRFSKYLNPDFTIS